MKPYTPNLMYISPPVIYYDSLTEVWFDPKSVPRIVTNLLTDERAFVNVEIGGSKLDFEGRVDSTTSLSQWRKNRVVG